MVSDDQFKPGVARRRPDASGPEVQAGPASALPVASGGGGLGRVAMAGRQHKTTWFPRRGWRVFGHYAVVFVYGGGGRYEDDNGLSVRIEPGDLILVFPELGHRYGPDGQDLGWWREYYLVFEGPVFDLWRQQGLLSTASPVRRLSPVSVWQSKWESVLSEPRRAWAMPGGRDTGRDPSTVEVCRLQQVLAEALAQPGENATAADSGPDPLAARPADEAWLSRAKELLETNLGQPLDLTAVARELHTSYATFRRRFRRLSGLAPGRFRERRRIELACQLMQDGALSDQQIAARLGFCDEAHFSRRFKHVIGRPPRAYRRSLP